MVQLQMYNSQKGKENEVEAGVNSVDSNDYVCFTTRQLLPYFATYLDEAEIWQNVSRYVNILSMSHFRRKFSLNRLLVL